MTSTPEQIQELIEEMENEVTEIKRSAIQFSWHMRGGISYNDIMNMSHEERKMISELIKSNLETTKQSKLPYF